MSNSKQKIYIDISRKIFFIPIFWETSVTIGCDIIEFKGSANDSDFQTYTVRNPNNYQNNLNDSTFINEIFELGDDVEFSLFKERHKGNIIRITKSGKYIIEYYYANGNILSTISLDKKDLRKLPGNQYALKLGQLVALEAENHSVTLP